MMCINKVKCSGVKIAPQSDLRVGAALLSQNPKSTKREQQCLQICTYNCRTLVGDDRLMELEEELKNINWSIVGLSEVRRKGENCLRLKSGNLLYYCGEPNGKLNGVGFLVNKTIVDKISVLEGTSGRIARLVLKISERYKIQIVQVYAPTSTHSDEEIESFYECLKETCEIGRDCFYKFIIGDFNAKVGIYKEGDSVVGKYGIDERNDRGERLVQFAECMKTPIMNTFFKKHPTRKWTWRSPNFEVKNEIDFILTNRPQNVKDVTVLNRFKTSSDHRLVRAKFEFNTKYERLKLTKGKRKILNVKKLEEQREEFQERIKRKLKECEAEEVAKILTMTAEEVGGLCKTQNQPKKLTNKTIDLMDKRRKMKVNTDKDMIKYAELCKALRKSMKEDIKKYEEDVLKTSLENKSSFKKVKRMLMVGRNQLIALDTDQGRITDKKEILEYIGYFYSNLYSKTNEDTLTLDELDAHVSQIPEILPSEVKHAIDNMKKGTAPGNDDLSIDVLKLMDDESIKHLAKIFSGCLHRGTLPRDWNKAKIVLIHKKGSTKDIKNYRPISLLPILYKVFTRILTTRLSTTLDQAQPIEQAGFRTGFSTVDHIFTLREIISRTNEYHLPLCLAFIDFEKAFDSISHSALFSALKEQGIEQDYIEILHNIYKTSTAFVSVVEETHEFPIEKGVKQGDSISPKLFSAVLEKAMSKLNWVEKGIQVLGKRLNNLRFADDIVLFANNIDELQVLVNELALVCSEVGLKMNIDKTKIMINEWTPEGCISAGNTQLQRVTEYVYLGQLINMKGDLKPEILRRIKLGWQAYGRHSSILKSKMSVELKKTIYDQCILPVITYGCETWTLNEFIVRKLIVSQRGMERSMLGYTKKDRKRATEIRRTTKVTDIMERVNTLKWQWAGHVSRTKDGRWSKQVLDWSPIYQKRPKGRPPDRWDRSIKKTAGFNWQKEAQDRRKWKNLLGSFVTHRLKEATSLSDRTG